MIKAAAALFCVVAAAWLLALVLWSPLAYLTSRG